MATVNYIQERTQTVSVMKRVIDYCSREDKTIEQETGIRYLSGVNCEGTNAFEDFVATKMLHRKTGGFMFYHYDQSFHPDEKLTHAEAHKIACEFAEKAWRGHEVLVATHCDAKHVHSHFVINSVSFQDGKKLHQTPNTLIELRKLSDNICREHGLSVLADYRRGRMKGLSTKEYRAALRGNSWKYQLKFAIRKCMSMAQTKDEFIDEMKDQGYGVTWTPERKYITYQCPNGKKCRDKSLGDDRYLKENMEKEFKIRQSVAPQNVPTTGWEKEREKLLQMKKEELRSLHLGKDFAYLVASFVSMDGGSEDPEEIEREIRAKCEMENLAAVVGGTIGIMMLIDEIAKARATQNEWNTMHRQEPESHQEDSYGYEEDDDEEQDDDESEGFIMMM